ALTALAEAARLRQFRPSGDVSALTALFDHAAEPVRAAAVRLAGGWSLPAAVPRVKQLASDRATPLGLRLAALGALRLLPAPGGATVLKSLAVDTAEPFAIRRLAALSLLASAQAEAIAPLRDLLAATTTEPDVGSLWRAVLAASTTSNRLATALREQPLP